MAVPAIPPIGAAGAAAGVESVSRPAPGFGDAIMRGLEQVSSLEQRADAMTQDVATGGPVQIHELMVATTEASLGIEMLAQVRNRAVEAYQQIMQLQV